MLHSICQQIWKTQQWPQDWKRSVFIPIPKKGNAKECSNYRTTALISHISKVMLKILQARLQQYVNRKLPDVQAGFWKGRGTRDQIANICWIIKKAEEFQINIYFCLTDNTQPWRTPFPICNQYVVPCPVLTVASWPAYRFLKRQIRWSGMPISFRIFHSLLWSTQSKALA